MKERRRLIDPNGFSNNNPEDTELNDCSIFQSTLHGLEILSGQAIRVIGGQYSGNGPSPDGGAGIAITGACGDVAIVGANLNAKYHNRTIPQSQVGVDGLVSRSRYESISEEAQRWLM